MDDEQGVTHMFKNFYELIMGCLVIIPATLFLFITFSSVILRVAGIKLPIKACNFVLKAYGWLGEGEVVYPCKYTRWGSGIVFLFSYGAILDHQLGRALEIPTIENFSILIGTFVIAYCAFFLFVGSYYGGASYNNDELIISPLRLTAEIRLTKNEKKQLTIKSVGNISLVYCPQWKQGRLVLLSKKQLTALIK